MKRITAIALSLLAGCGKSDDAASAGDPDASSASDGPSQDSSLEGAPLDGPSSDAADGSTPSGLHVVMGSGGAPGHIVDGSGTVVQLHGVDRSGTEDTCDYAGVFDTPVDQAAINAMKSWKINSVRVPLNEDCWLGINGVTTGGATYRSAIKTYVDLLTSNGLIVILDLHWAAPGMQKAQGQLGMADVDHAPTFWTEVATAYGNVPTIIFDLFNEPFITDWDCWLVGGMCAKDYANATYNVAGMASLIKAVRKTGARNVLILGGLGYASDFAQWVAKVNSIPTLPPPNDGIALTNIAASWHTYSSQSVQTMCPSQYNGYSTGQTCVSGSQNAINYGVAGILAAGYPVVMGEIGIDVYASSTGSYSAAQATMLTTWLESALTYMDAQKQGYLAWDWNTSAPPLLLTSFDGSATPYFGATYKAHLAALPK